MAVCIECCLFIVTCHRIGVVYKPTTRFEVRVGRRRKSRLFRGWAPGEQVLVLSGVQQGGPERERQKNFWRWERRVAPSCINHRYTYHLRPTYDHQAGSNRFFGTATRGRWPLKKHGMLPTTRPRQCPPCTAEMI